MYVHIIIIVVIVIIIKTSSMSYKDSWLYLRLLLSPFDIAMYKRPTFGQHGACRCPGSATQSAGTVLTPVQMSQSFLSIEYIFVDKTPFFKMTKCEFSNYREMYNVYADGYR